MTTTRETLALAELAYQQAPRATSEPTRLARLAAVRQAVADGWTHAAIAEAMGKSRGWVGQRATVAPTVRACSGCPNAHACQYGRICRHPAEPTPFPADISSRAIDRFRRTET